MWKEGKLMKVCNDCGKELPDDSVFCPYCGSKNIGTKKETLGDGTTNKFCKSCNKNVPDDSEFCPYCGNKNIIDLSIADHQEEKVTNDINENKNGYKTKFIIACVLCAILTLWAVAETNNYNNLQTEIEDINTSLGITDGDISKLKTKVGTYNTYKNQADTYREKANKYEALSKIENQITYSDYRANVYYVNSNNYDVKIYWNGSSNQTIEALCSNSKLDCKWSKSWKTEYGVNYTFLNVSCSKGGYGTIKISNSEDNRVFYIFVENN